MNPIAAVLGAFALAGGFVLARRLRRKRQQQYIRSASFPSAVRSKLSRQYPQLEPQQIGLILRTLRDYFAITWLARGKMVAMPSAAVDSAWHEFILCTAAYASFCQQAFGRFLHHTPAEAMGSPAHLRDSLKLCWKLACELENIDPHRPQKLPRLFALDTQLNFPGGYYYTLPAANTGLAAPAGAQDASTIGCTSSCGSSCSDSDAGSGDSGCCVSSCGSGCGGGGD